MAGEASPNIYWNMGNTAVFYHNERLVQRAQTLVQGTPILEDAVMMAANEMLGNYGLRQQSFDQPQLTELGGYVSGGISQYEPYSEGMAKVGRKLEVDMDTYKKRGSEWLMNTALPDAREGFRQACEKLLIDGSAADYRSIDGFKARRSYADNEGGDGYDAESPDPTTAAQYGVYHCGGTGAGNTRIIAIQWGKSKTSLLYPADGEMGLSETALKEVEVNHPTVTAASKTILRKYFSRELGINVADEHSLATVVGIPTAISSIGTARSMIYLLIRALNEWFDGPETVWLYVSPRTETFFIQLMNEGVNVQMSRDNPWRMDIPSLAGKYPIRRCKAISENETVNTDFFSV